MIPEKGKCLCNRGCVRVGNLTEQEAIDCQKKCRCDNCSDDVRQLCYKQFIVDNDTSPYGFGYSLETISKDKVEPKKKEVKKPVDEYSGKLICNFGCKDGVCTEEEIQWCKDNIPCDSCDERECCIERKRKGLTD